jgi:major vault protein
MSEAREKRDLVLAPGTYAYMQDVTKGQIIVFTGPTVINQTAQEVPVIYEPQDGTFCRCGTLEEAVRQAPIAVEGYYLVLKNPARKGEHPMEGGRQIAPELDVGRKINIPGPCMFALWPGQDAQVVRGHHLRSNQYLLVRVYNEDEARKNWAMAVVKPASPEPGTPPTTENIHVATTAVPRDLTVGRLLIIRGTEVSFYIPPTGIGVLPEGAENSKPRYVRDALTLERLEYCILVDENGNKRYERGPRVVFPEPTERFVENKEAGKKFRAIELNEIQGLHIKVIAPYRDDVAGKSYNEGDELFITGKDTAIYFPRQEHSLISYDGKSKHFATAIPAGEARYMMNRMTGAITTIKGPAMLLPDPRTEVIVRRVLSDKQVNLWYPGNEEALEYNRQLRQLLVQSPTTRQGAISEGDYERGMRKQLAGKDIRRGMEQSRVSGDQALVADEFSRASSYTQPRTVTLDTKFQGVPSTDVWTGYAIMIVSKTGKRRVEQGPTTVLLEYDESLEVLELSTGKPKTTDNLIRTVFLRIVNNKVSDIINVETADHVSVEIYLSHRVNFEGDPVKWFDVENYVKFLCDHVRSVLKGALKKVRVEDFYANFVDIIRDILLGKAVEEGKRPGMFFPENGMRVCDVEVLRVTIGDERIRGLLDEAQHEVVKSQIELASAQRNLEMTQAKERIDREIAEIKTVTTKRHHELEVEVIGSQLAVLLSKIGSQLRQEEERKRAEIARQTVLDLTFDGDLARLRRQTEQQEEMSRAAQGREIERLRAEAEAMITRFQAAQPGFSEALLSLSHEETIVKVAEALSVQNFLGGKNFAEVVQKVFAGTPLQPLMERLTAPPRKDGDRGRREQPPAR